MADNRGKGNAFDAVKIRLASPETILSWSYGEVTKPETINYRTQKPEKDGLFCERIFGPVKDYECNCGKYKGIKNKGVVCEKCGVEVTLSKVRRERMGHIKLATPVVHIWYYKVPPSRIGLLLDKSLIKLERVIYYESFAVISPGDTSYRVGDVITTSEYKEIIDKKPVGFVALMGGEAILELLKNVNIEDLSLSLRSLMKVESSPDKRRAILRRLRVVESLRNSGISPEWMVTTILPVIPPDLRPLVPLEGGRYASSDLNDLYRRVITRNNRLKNMIAARAPEIILRNEKRMLQEAVDAVLDNSRRKRPVLGRGQRPLKSLSDSLKGKQGRFRQNLLGKRVDYSGRSVIVVGPELKIYQCGIPRVMALELFKPFIVRRLAEQGYAQSIKSARRLLERGTKEVWDILEEVVKDHPVLLNRAPTLHRLSIQAFMPVLVDGKAIRLHPLVCMPFNADFDGDQMAVHVPLSFEAQAESLGLMNSANNILSPANGSPISIPTQDIIIGIYYLTKERVAAKGEGRSFASTPEVEHALESGKCDLHARIRYYLPDKTITTTPGRILFSRMLPDGIDFVNKVVDKKVLSVLIEETIRKLGNYEAVRFLDRIKDIGFEYATISGITIGIDDMVVPANKEELIDKAYEEVKEMNRAREAGVITEAERYNRVVDIWSRTVSDIEKASIEVLSKDKGGFNPLYSMMESGARGNIDQVRQITGLRGLMTKPQRHREVGETIETPIRSNLKEGLSVVEYFISTHGARKGLTDTALKTSQAGYLTRKLVDVAQDVIVTTEDCGAVRGRSVMAIKEGEDVIQPLHERIQGRFALEDVINPITTEVIVFAGEEITDEKAIEIEECGIESVTIRSVLTCEARRGLCQKCYGRNLAIGRLVEIGEAVGVMAAQSIGEPGTQLTLRTFHIGGTATRVTRESFMKAPFDGHVEYKNLRIVEREEEELVNLSRDGKLMLKGKDKKTSYNVPYGAVLSVRDKDLVMKKETLFEWDPYAFVILAEQKGKIKFENMIENLTYRLEYDERIGSKQPVIMEHKRIHPEVKILADGKPIWSYILPTGAYMFVNDGEDVNEGRLLAKLPREISRTRDITVGLPRVIQLFEARRPKNIAIVSEIDGVCEFGKIKKGYRFAKVVGEHETRTYRIPVSKHIIVYDGQKVKAGDKLCEGEIDPHDILRVSGVNAVEEYLVNQIQEVYRLQGVKIDDKHISIIVRQMLSKGKVADAGDTSFIEGEIVEKWRAFEENERVKKLGLKPAITNPVLLGITRAILTTESFISAASFQETTRVLTDASLMAKSDRLRGIKENVIVGNLIPVGTGLTSYKNIRIKRTEKILPMKKEQTGAEIGETASKTVEHNEDDASGRRGEDKF
jgi:DNA-directed RNA polymerase subunit beta'